MTDTENYIETLRAHLAEEADELDPGARAQRAYWLLNHIGAISAPEATLDRRLLDGCGRVEDGLNIIRRWADDTARGRP